MLYTCNRELGGPISIVNLINNVAGAPGAHLTGEVPVFNRNFTVGLDQSQGRLVGQNDLVQSVGLVTCASVIYAHINPITNQFITAYVYHAPSGDVQPVDVTDALTALGNPPIADVYVIYAHKGSNDDSYTDNTVNITEAGIPAFQVLEIENLPETKSLFGIDDNGNIG